jgi:hypothetical protein
MGIEKKPQKAGLGKRANKSAGLSMNNRMCWSLQSKKNNCWPLQEKTEYILVIGGEQYNNIAVFARIIAPQLSFATKIQAGFVGKPLGCTRVTE